MDPPLLPLLLAVGAAAQAPRAVSDGPPYAWETRGGTPWPCSHTGTYAARWPDGSVGSLTMQAGGRVTSCWQRTAYAADALMLDTSVGYLRPVQHKDCPRCAVPPEGTETCYRLWWDAALTPSNTQPGVPWLFRRQRDAIWHLWVPCVGGFLAAVISGLGIHSSTRGLRAVPAEPGSRPLPVQVLPLNVGCRLPAPPQPHPLPFAPAVSGVYASTARCPPGRTLNARRSCSLLPNTWYHLATVSSLPFSTPPAGAELPFRLKPAPLAHSAASAGWAWLAALLPAENPAPGEPVFTVVVGAAEQSGAAAAALALALKAGPPPRGAAPAPWGFVAAVDTYLGGAADWRKGSLRFRGGHATLYAEALAAWRAAGVADHVAPFPTAPSVAALWFRRAAAVASVVVFGSELTDPGQSGQPTAYDLAEWWPLVAPGGVLAGRGWHDPGLRRAVRSFAQQSGAAITYSGEGRWLLRRVDRGPAYECAARDAAAVNAQLRQMQPAAGAPETDGDWRCASDAHCGGPPATCRSGACACARPGVGGQRCEVSVGALFGPHNPWAAPPALPAESQVQGWNSGAENFREVFEEVQIRTVIEVGVWHGGSTLSIAAMLKQRGQGGVIVSVDTFLGSYEHWFGAGHGLHIREGYPTYYEIFRANTLAAGLQDYVIPFPAPSVVAWRVFRDKGVLADMVHVDASHEYLDAKTDFYLWWSLVRPGGVMYGDDYYHSGNQVQRAVDEFVAETGATLKHYGWNRRLKNGIEGVKWGIQKPGETYAAP